MTKRARVSLVFLSVGMMMAVASGAEKFRDYSRISFSGKVVQGRPLDVGVDHDGVKVETITFGDGEAMIIVWNRNGHAVNVNAGLALYDKDGRLLAAESDDRPIRRSVLSIRSGKQANLTIKFRKFLSDFDGATKFQLAMVIVEKVDS